MTALPPNRVLWCVMAATCIVFAPMAAEFYLVTVTASTATYAKVLGSFVSEEYAFGPRSGFAQMTPYWRSMPPLNQLILGVHAALASVALLVGPVQFLGGARERWPKLHRGAGRIYFLAGVPSILLSMVYLCITPMEEIYGGPPFAIGLWGIAILTLFTFGLGLMQVLKGQIAAHRATMVLNFSALLIAPLLRVWWGVLGWIFLDQPFNGQDHSHTAVLMFLGLETLMGAIVVMHVYGDTLPHRTEPSSLKQLRKTALKWLPAATKWGTLLGGGLGFVVFHEYLLRFVGPFDLFPGLRNADFTLREGEVFSDYSWAFVCKSIGLATLLLCSPQRIRQLFLTLPSPPTRATEVAFNLGWLVASAGWVGQALGFGMHGVSGWGSSVYWLACALAMVVLGTLRLHSARHGRLRKVRELTLHIFALALTPLTFLVLQACFLAAAFTWEDAFLSAGVLATSINLSFSYYYTGYGLRNAAPRTARGV